MDKYTELQDNELIALSQKGDGNATEALIIRYKALVCKIARNFNIRSGGDTEDLIQEGTIGLLKAVREFDESKKVPFLPYASTCISNTIRDTMRNLQRAKHAILSNAITISVTDEDGEPILIDLPDKSGTPLTNYQESEKKKSFYEAVEKIVSPYQIEVLKLYFDGASYKDIAEKLGITMKKVDNTITTIKNKIKRNPALFKDLG